MTWCNLSLTESKYNLHIQPSRWRTWLFFTEIIVMASLVGIFAYLFLSTDWLIITYLLVMTLLMVGYFFYGRQYQSSIHAVFVSRLNHDNGAALHEQTSHIVEITTNGLLRNNLDTIWQISPNSKCHYLGCYLVLIKLDTKTLLPIKPYQKNIGFLFKDQCSFQDYRRLCRIVLTCKQSKLIQL